jgi:hypothetical protein
MKEDAKAAEEKKRKDAEVEGNDDYRFFVKKIKHDLDSDEEEEEEEEDAAEAVTVVEGPTEEEKKAVQNKERAEKIVKEFISKYAAGREFDPERIVVSTPMGGANYASGAGWIPPSEGFKVEYSYKGFDLYYYERVTTKIDDVDLWKDIKITVDDKIVYQADKI